MYQIALLHSDAHKIAQPPPMEQLPGAAVRSRHRGPPSSERFLGALQPPQPSAASPPLELTEDDIFSTHLECLPPYPARPIPNLSPKPTPNTSLNHYGILAALNSSLRSRSGSNTRPVFNHKASPATSGVVIPRPPPIRGERDRFVPRSAPVNIPVMPAAMRRRAREMDDTFSERDEEEDMNGVILPPHEMVASRDSPVLACSVMEGTGRTLKGRDLRQVRNAVFRKTGFID